MVAANTYVLSTIMMKLRVLTGHTEQLWFQQPHSQNVEIYHRQVQQIDYRNNELETDLLCGF